jgi:hypothetical protein
VLKCSMVAHLWTVSSVCARRKEICVNARANAQWTERVFVRVGVHLVAHGPWLWLRPARCRFAVLSMPRTPEHAKFVQCMSGSKEMVNLHELAQHSFPNSFRKGHQRIHVSVRLMPVDAERNIQLVVLCLRNTPIRLLPV